MFCRTWLWIGLAAGLLSATSGLRCFSCNSVDSNNNCNRVIRCPGGSTGCGNVVRMENGILRITKGCQQYRRCLISSRQNYRQCSTSVQSILKSSQIKATRNLPPSVCRTCCNTDLCNRKLFLDQANPFGRANSRTNIFAIPSRPSIRNVRVTLLTPDTALITFVDNRNHCVNFFNVRLQPRYSAQIIPVKVPRGILPGFKRRVPRGALAFLVRKLAAGTRYRISIVSKRRNVYYTQNILRSFITAPRRPKRIQVMKSSVSSLKIFVQMPRYQRGDRVSSYSVSIRKASDPPGAAKRIPDFNRPISSRIENLEPSTAYVITAWTNVKNDRGRIVKSSRPINVTAYTDVPGIAEINLAELHATSLTWRFRVPSDTNPQSQQQFVVQVRDDTNKVFIAEAVLSNRERSFTVRGLTPQTAYTFSVRALTNGHFSKRSYSKPVFTVIRCYSCLDAASRDECDQYIECPPDASGCLNEVRRRSFSHASTSAWYRASLVCKQVRACNNSEDQDKTMQCNPNRDRYHDPPNVCRCCCEGDLCNGPGSTCGHILGWLDPFRAPATRRPTPPPYCPDPDVAFATVRCTQGNEIGSECNIECSPDTLLVGRAGIICSRNGKWNHPLPRCDPLPICPSFEPNVGTTHECSNGFKAGSVCEFKCQEGYVRVGEMSLTCEASGKWSEELVPACVSIDFCLPNRCLNGATCHNQRNGFDCECRDGFTGRFCEEEVFCETLEQPDNGLVQCTNGNRVGSRCRYLCVDGFEQHGPTYVRCLADGKWSNNEPTMCVVKTCPVPPQRLINGGRTECTGFEIGDTCFFSCPSGLAISGGPTNITCQEDQTWTNNVPCCDLPCPPHARVDLYILLDSSSSIGRSNWRLLINFVNTLLDQFVIGPNDMKVGVGRYNSDFDTKSEISFGDYDNGEHLKFKIQTMRYNGRGTLTGKALRHVHEKSLKHPGNRKGVSDIVLVVTDGRAQDDVAAPASAIKSDMETKIYAIGVRNLYNYFNYSQLESIASGPRYLQIIDDGYQALARELGQTLIEDVCWVPCQFQYQQREILERQRLLVANKADQLDAEYWEAVDNKNNNTNPRPRSTIASEANP